MCPQIADVKRVSREIKILKKVRHHNVIQLMEVIDAPKQIFLVMELTDSGEVRAPFQQARAFLPIAGT